MSMGFDDKMSAENLKKVLSEAIDKTEEQWNLSLISGSRPAHLYTSVLLSVGEWYGIYLASMKEAIKHMEESTEQSKEGHNE